MIDPVTYASSPNIIVNRAIIIVTGDHLLRNTYAPVYSCRIANCCKTRELPNIQYSHLPSQAGTAVMQFNRLLGCAKYSAHLPLVTAQPPCSYAYEIYTTFKFTNLPEQSTRFCSLRETSLPVALKCWPSREPVVLNAQQEPHWPWGWRKQPGIKVADTEHLTYITDLRHSVAN